MANYPNHADELNRMQWQILGRFPALMGLDDAGRRPIMDELMELEDLRAAVKEADLDLGFMHDTSEDASQ